MRISLHWLREWLDIHETPAEVGHRLTMAGLELDALESAAQVFSGVVVGTVQQVEPHPDAERLRVCQVDAGDGRVRTIVCGAANVAAGMRVAVALPGAHLPGGVAIGQSTVRGVASEGMLCSGQELGLEESSPGILELPAAFANGEDLWSLLALEDSILEVDLTPNRADCLSILGIARELAVLLDRPLRMPEIPPVLADSERSPRITIAAPDACPAYAARFLGNLDCSAQTPMWMRERLRRAGIRPLYPAVDVTNYVMLELGQPLHAFDADLLGPDIEVRWGRASESLVLLGGQEVQLDSRDLVIANPTGPVALAGVMGGEATAITAATRSIVFESAHFTPRAVAGRARAHGLHTDASHRFERGVDPTLPLYALERATQLLQEIAGGVAGPVVLDGEIPNAHVETQIVLRAARIPRVLGIAFAPMEVERILTGLGCLVQPHDEEDGWQVRVPRARFDLTREEDLIEELARVHGYERLPQTLPSRSLPQRLGSASVLNERKRLLADLGFFEVITFSFIPPEWSEAFFPQAGSLTLANPISSDLSVMRPGLWPGLVRVAQHNLARQQSTIKIFEHGLAFNSQNNEIQQENRFSGLLCGQAEPESWLRGKRPLDFFDAKAVVESLAAAAGLKPDFLPAQHPALHDGQTALIRVDGQPCGWLGALHPRLRQRFDLPELFLFDLHAAWVTADRVARFHPLSIYPAVRRDLAIVVDEQVNAADILSTIAALELPDLRELRVFDVYRGGNLEKNEKSIALGLILRAFDRTLAEKDVETATVAILDELKARWGARPRS
jgi:phenylalanyl-tRNA synthetase beta chain